LILSLDQAKQKDGLENFDTKIDACLNLLKNLGFYYTSRNTEAKQRILSSILREKLVFENKIYRTPVLNRAIQLICRKNTVSWGKTGWKYTLKTVPSHGVEPGRFSFAESPLSELQIKEQNVSHFPFVHSENISKLIFSPFHKRRLFDSPVEPGRFELPSKQGTKMLSTRLAVV